MANLKCAMCSSPRVLGPTHAGERSNTSNAVNVALEFTDVSKENGNRQYFKGAKRASVCLDCGHIAIFASESLLAQLRKVAMELRPIGEDS